MFALSTAQLSGIQRERASELSRRIDTWLSSELADWEEEPQSERLEWVDEILDSGRKAGLRSEMDFALFARIVANHRPDWRKFLNAPEQSGVLTCQRRHSGAKIRELSLRSEEIRGVAKSSSEGVPA